MGRLLIATNNAHKVTEFRRLLGACGWALVTPREVGLALDVAEDGTTFAQNAALKAHAFAKASGLPALADDSGIEVDALGGRPGVYSARYGGPSLIDAGRVGLLLQELAGVPDTRRTARYLVVLALALPDGALRTAEGACEGRIAHRPQGTGGFGYDPVFFIAQHGCTVGDLSPAQKDAISHRGQAARAMAFLLRELAAHGATA
ncbi:MAG: RdgB/HAM1 family non-canonical purine NTP pyrophosphatase [Chloroflexota bacterium]